MVDDILGAWNGVSMIRVKSQETTSGQMPLAALGVEHGIQHQESGSSSDGQTRSGQWRSQVVAMHGRSYYQSSWLVPSGDLFGGMRQ